MTSLIMNIKTSEQEFFDLIVTSKPYPTNSELFLQKHLDSGALMVKIANESDLPLFADNAEILGYLIEMQKSGGMRRQCVLCIVGDDTDYSVSVSSFWQLFGGLCIVVPDEKRMNQALLEIASFDQSSTSELLISLPYISYDVVHMEKEHDGVYPFLLQVISATNNGDAMKQFGINSKHIESMRQKIGIPANMKIWDYKTNE